MPSYATGFRVAGSVGNIPLYEGVRATGTIDPIVLSSQFRSEGNLDGEDFSSQMKMDGTISTISASSRARIDATLVPHPLSDQVKIGGSIVPIAMWSQVVMEGNLVYGYEMSARCTGWIGTRPRRPPYDLRMTLDHHIRRMRGTVKLYHYPLELETHDHQALVKPAPTEYNLTGYVFFARDRMSAIEARREGIVDIYQAHLVIDSSKLPAGLSAINEKHDIIEYDDAEGQVLKYRFREHGISFEEWHGLIEYRLISMGRGRQFSLYRRTGVKSAGTIIGELYDARARMEGIVALQSKDQIRIAGEVLWHTFAEQVGVRGNVIPIPHTHSMRMEGEIDWIPHHHEMRVEGEVDWIPLRSQVRAQGITSAIPHWGGIRADGEVDEMSFLMFYSILEDWTMKTGSFMSHANQTAVPVISAMVRKFGNMLNTQANPSLGMKAPQWKQEIYERGEFKRQMW